MTSPATTRPPAASSSWHAAALLYLAVIAGFIAMYLPQPILPVLAREFAVRPSTASLTVAVLIFALAGASLVIGPLSDRLGRKPVLVSCTLLLTVPTLLCALAPNLPALLGLRFLQGVLLPGLTAASVAYITEEFPPRLAGPLLGGYIAATVTGGLISRVLSGAVTATLGWRWAFVIGAVLLLVAGLLLLRLPTSRHFKANRDLSRAYLGMLRHLGNPRLVGGFLVGLTLFFAFIAVFTYLPFYLEAPPFNFSPLTIGLIYLVYLAGVISSPLAGVLARRFSRRQVMVSAFALVIAANIATLLPERGWLIGSLLLLCFGNFAAQSAATSYVAVKARQERAGASALYLFAYYVGGSLGAYLPGLLWPQHGWLGVLWLTLLALALGATAAALLCRP